MAILATIAALYAPAMLQAVAVRAVAFWLAQTVVTCVLIGLWIAPRREMRIWR